MQSAGCKLKILKIQIVVQTVQFFLRMVVGQNNNKVKEVNIVQIKIKGDNGLCIFIEAISYSKICSPIRNQKYHFPKNNYDHLRNINLLE